MTKISTLKIFFDRVKTLALLVIVLAFLTGAGEILAQDESELMNFFTSSAETNPAPSTAFAPSLPPDSGALKPSIPPVQSSPTPAPTASAERSGGVVATSATEGYFDSASGGERGQDSSGVRKPGIREAGPGTAEDSSTIFVDPYAAPSFAAPDVDAEAIFRDVAPLPPLDDGGPVTVPLGQGLTLPPTQWETVGESGIDASHYLSEAPRAHFDSSQGQWLQLDVGQADMGGVTPEPEKKPTPVTSVPTVVDRSNPVDKVISQALGTPPGAGRTLESSEVERLRHLFSDMLPPDSRGARAGGAKVSAPAADSLPSVPPATPAVRGSGRGDSSILQAGGLLTVESQMGRAEILPPGAPLKLPGGTVAVTPPAPVPSAPVPIPPAKVETVPAPAQVVTRPASQGLKPPSRSTPKQRSRPGRTPARATSFPAGIKAELAIINETGQVGIGESYRSVLLKMGFRVVSLGQGTDRTTEDGLTIINYRRGYGTQAKAVARHLPGKKVLVEAKKGEVLASEIMVYLR